MSARYLGTRIRSFLQRTRAFAAHWSVIVADRKMVEYRIDWEKQRLYQGIETTTGPIFLSFSAAECREQSELFMKFALDLEEGKGAPIQ